MCAHWNQEFKQKGTGGFEGATILASLFAYKTKGVSLKKGSNNGRTKVCPWFTWSTEGDKKVVLIWNVLCWLYEKVHDEKCELYS